MKNCSTKLSWNYGNDLRGNLNNNFHFVRADSHDTRKSDKSYFMTTTLLNLCNSSILIFGARGQLIMMHRNIELKMGKGQRAKQSR